ncbi:MAG: glycosyltransferase, partial [Evtepia sp.]
MKIKILGVSFDPVSLDEAVSIGSALVAGGDFHYVVTPNPEIVNLARADASYREILNHAALVLP